MIKPTSGVSNSEKESSTVTYKEADHTYRAKVADDTRVERSAGNFLRTSKTKGVISCVIAVDEHRFRAQETTTTD